MPRPTSWTDQDLIDASEICNSLHQVCMLLDLQPGGGTYRTLERHMVRLGLGAMPVERTVDRRRRSRRAWADDDLARAVRDSVSIAEVWRRLGYTTSGGIHRFIKQHISRLGLDTSHFTGQSWAKGRSFLGTRVRPLAEILVEHSTYSSSSTLRKRLIAEGIKAARCESCGRSQWLERVLPLELDHINGDPSDNRLDNLRILCPNCHAVTETWCRATRKPA